MQSTELDILQAALSYAARGWRVLPCDPRSKRPVTDHGLKDATANEKIIREWWKKWPGAMIGCRTGRGSGIWVVDLDVDAKKGVDGITAFAKLAEGQEPVPDTNTTRTPRGGLHLFFKWTDGIKNSAGRLAVGVDTRGEGGYIILPPSRRSDGKTYDSICAVSELPEAPRWMIDMLATKGEPEPATDDLNLAEFSRAAHRYKCGNGHANVANGYGGAALKAECAKLASALPGTRNHMLNAAAFSLGQLVAGGALREGDVRVALRRAAYTCGLIRDDGDAAVCATMESGLAAGMAKPRTAPERTTSPIVAMKARATHEKHGGVSLEDFYGYMPLHSYIFIPSRELWPASSVNAILPPLPLSDAAGKSVLDKNGEPKLIKPSTWLDKNRRIEMMTWCPGESGVIADRLVAEGGWIDRIGCSTFNLYRPPIVAPGDPGEAGPWLDHVHRVYGDDAGHIILWLAHRAQRPQEKINHALVLGGLQGIGKDTLLEPAKHTVGPWNFIEVSPQHLLGRFNGFVKSVILRVNEARDLGDVNRFSFYDHLKAYTAAPPDVLRVDEKHLREYSVFNVCGVIITTNHKADGIFLPADDRRHYVAWSDKNKDDFSPEYWHRLWQWYAGGGIGHVAAYLRQFDIAEFDPKAPPPKTAAFWDIVDASRSPDDAELADALDSIGRPAVTTIAEIMEATMSATFVEWLNDRKNRRTIPHRMEACGYTPFRNTGAKDGFFKVNGRRQVIYALAELSTKDRHLALTDYLKHR